jgi:hypothetical protein
VKAAQASADAISRQMRLDQRPWIKVEIAGTEVAKDYAIFKKWTSVSH